MAIPTPTPEPTPVLPSGATVNPADPYRLTDTTTFSLCWPHCDPQPQIVAFHDAVIHALDGEFDIEPLETHQVPLDLPSPEPSDGAFVWILFGSSTPGGHVTAFGYNRTADLVILPHHAGWITAPPDLIAIFTDLEPPPLPSKE